MAHYAFLDENNIVTEVIVGRDETEVVNGISDWETHYGNIRGQVCKRTSYNSNIRRYYAGIGFSYDPVRDEFVLPKPYPSWSLDFNNDWQAPVQKPSEDGLWSWHEDTQEWTR
jgi:hypothetical protein